MGTEDRLGGQGNTTFEDVANPLAPGGKKEVTAAFLNAVISALNSDAFNANTVSGYGIGIVTTDVVAFDSMAASGMYRYAGSGTDTRAPNTHAGSVMALINSTVDWFLTADHSTGYLLIGSRAHGAGAISWQTLWSGGTGNSSDGNGGQPPAPKPTTGANSLNNGASSGTILSLDENTIWLFTCVDRIGAGGFACAIAFRVGSGNAEISVVNHNLIDFAASSANISYVNNTGYTADFWWTATKMK